MNSNFIRQSTLAVNRAVEKQIILQNESEQTNSNLKTKLPRRSTTEIFDPEIISKQLYNRKSDHNVIKTKGSKMMINQGIYEDEDESDSDLKKRAANKDLTVL